MHYTTLHSTTLHYLTPHYTTLNYTTLHYPTPHCITLHYIALRSLHHHKCNCNYTTLITPHHNYNSTTLKLQLQLHYTTLHPAVVGDVTDQVATSTIAAVPKKQLQPPFGPSVDSLCHPWFTTTNLSYRLPIFETSATALCGTTGKSIVNAKKRMQTSTSSHWISPTFYLLIFRWNSSAALWSLGSLGFNMV